MARVTVEDCIDKVPNRFKLVLLAAHRSRMIAQGAPLQVERDRDKNPVVSLREIADEALSSEDLEEELIHSLQKHVEVDEPEEETVPLIAASAEAAMAGQEELDSNRMSEEDLLKGMQGLVPPDRKDDY